MGMAAAVIVAGFDKNRSARSLAITSRFKNMPGPPISTAKIRHNRFPQRKKDSLGPVSLLLNSLQRELNVAKLAAVWHFVNCARAFFAAS
jgi:hypothetical protein